MKLSIIIPVKDEYAFIRRCLDSVLPQLQDGVEVIVIDDGSTDGTTEILKEYLDKDGIKIFRQDKSRGVSSARNAGIEISQGEYITFLDADDEYLPSAVQTMLEATEKGENIVQFNHYRSKDGDVRMTHRYINRSGVYTYQNRPSKWCYVWNKIYKRDFLAELNVWFKDGMQFGEDELFNIKCMLESNIYHSPHATVKKCSDNNLSICHRILPEMLHKQDDALVSLYWRLQFMCRPKEQIEAVKDIILEHRKSKLYINVGLEAFKI